ncbi:squamosa promoter-binding-like protein 7 [Salvia miltiorrhiza]|uniref:squamosa promoter-binding-like protein 7 n=1 Tax=Salvia miltiorrhiza TaxID=226208 RepID=UPI0025AB6348|nr:squamosa promoter-binding-like protein 7 [Salvia miltiorrhiza]
MEHNSPPPIPSPVYLPSAAADPAESALFDWSDFLDFDIDEALNTPFAISEPGSGPEQELGSDQSENLGRVRKRDPRLLCPNFVAGVVPCACPELDKKLEEEEESALPGKKRTRALRAPAAGPLLCQVPGCEADISELKGYHKRHRVCLKCAHAAVVVLDGESKRYCQQCGKFHLLSNFDEGKRSCRRKLEKHNDRRRRKSNGSKGGTDKEPHQVVLVDDVKEDDDGGKDGTSPSSQIEEKEMLLKSDGHVSAVSSGPDSQGFLGEKVAPFLVPGEIHTNGHKHSPNSKRSASYSDNFSSVCPTGRISFKLYDWNPAEFPRRLRLQIFEWLASMPVELEGYIRPGCTILTAFIAMPKPMWLKLLDKPASCIKDLIGSPGSMLSGKGTMLVYVNDMIFRVTKDAHSVVQVSIKDRSPKLHYIYPTCFEAGRPMEFVACGSDLLQPKFRFLVSCDGRYLAYKICVSSLCCKKGESNSFNHQLVKISVPQTDMNLSGPAFIEVENQSGLSNFVPIFFGDKETCEEMEILQRTFDTSISSQEQPASPPRPACGVLASRQTRFSGFLLDLGWSLKKHVSKKLLTSADVHRFDYLLDFLIEKGSSVILERVSRSLGSSIDKNDVAGVSDSDMRSLRTKMGIVRCMLDHRTQDRGSAATPASDGNVHRQSKDACFVVQDTKTGVQETPDDIPWGREASSLDAVAATAPLVNTEVIMNVNIRTPRPHRSPGLIMSSRTFLTSRSLMTAVAAVCICFGVCVALFHPQRVNQVATTIRRCLVRQP